MRFSYIAATAGLALLTCQGCTDVGRVDDQPAPVVEQSTPQSPVIVPPVVAPEVPVVGPEAPVVALPPPAPVFVPPPAPMPVVASPASPAGAEAAQKHGHLRKAHRRHHGKHAHRSVSGCIQACKVHFPYTTSPQTHEQKLQDPAYTPRHECKAACMEESDKNQARRPRAVGKTLSTPSR